MPLDIKLDEATQAFLDEMVRSGRSTSTDDAVHHGLDLLRQREAAWKRPCNPGAS